MRLFEDSWKRFDRAVVHAKTFQRQWQRLVDPEASHIAIEMNSDWTEGTAKVIYRRPLPENDLALELGEMFYQLRATLDAALYQTMKLCGGFTTTTNQSNVEFPIYSTADKFKGKPINKPPFPNELRDWLESIQPYNIDKAINPSFVQSLQLLHDCARKDRHRGLHVVGATVASIKWETSITPPARVVAVQRIDGDLLKDQTPFLFFHLLGAGPHTEIKLDTDTFVEISIRDIPGVTTRDVGGKINDIFAAVKSCVEHLETAIIR